MPRGSRSRAALLRHSAARLIVAALCISVPLIVQAGETRSTEYDRLQARLAQGWNTWDTHSVTTHVLLPEGLSVSFGLFSDTALFQEHPYLDRALIGRQEPGCEQVLAGAHAYDGSYTELRLEHNGESVRVETATDAGDLVMLVSPLHVGSIAPTAVFRAGMLWNRAGSVQREGDHILATLPAKRIAVYATSKTTSSLALWTDTPFLAEPLDAPVGISTGHRRTLAQVQGLIARNRERNDQQLARYGRDREIAEAMHSVLGWDTIYEPTHNRVVTPVSRVWNERWGGYVLFDWDNFFAADMAALDNRDLAYANAIEMLNEVTPGGFVPNFARARAWRSNDRSEPPVGALVVLDLYRRYHDRWFVEQTFPALLTWNRWWARDRDRDGYLVWGSNAYNTPWAGMDPSAHTLQGAKFESGLDNSPMFDDAAFDPARSQMELADVGLMSLYIADCDALAELANALSQRETASELKHRADLYRIRLQTLWSESDGIFLNKNLDTGALSHRLSPTNFYPLLAKAATPAQAARMVHEHLMNPAEFWGEWVLPSIARNDPAFREQNYWRGRIWGPTNYLVYRGLTRYDLPEARGALVDKSGDLFLKEWRERRHIHENYNAISGEGDDVGSSDRFYHWGALLGYMRLLETEEHASHQP